jgi:hypothetical protein
VQRDLNHVSARDSSEQKDQRTISQSERDWAYAKRALARGDDPEEVIRKIADYRADDKHDPEDYALRTVTKAQAELQRGVAVIASTDVQDIEGNELSQNQREIP